MSAIQVTASGQVLVCGELTFGSVPQLKVSGCEIIAVNPQPVFDLSQVTTCDNAGVALLLAWTRYAKNMGKSIEFSKLPKQLLDIIEVSGLTTILPIQPE